MGAFAFPFASSFGSGFSFVPDTGAGTGGTALALLGATPAGGLAGQSDQLIDPATLDYVRTDDGEWAETADTRTAVICMLSIELGASPFDPTHGTTLAAARLNGDPITPEDVKAETERGLGVLAQLGLISDIVVQVRDRDGAPLADQSGRLLVQTSWRDLASGSPIDLLIQG